MANVHRTRVSDIGLGPGNVSHPPLDHRIQPSTRFHTHGVCQLFDHATYTSSAAHETAAPEHGRRGLAVRRSPSNEQRLRDRDLILTSKPCRWPQFRAFSNAILDRNAPCARDPPAITSCASSWAAGPSPNSTPARKKRQRPPKSGGPAPLACRRSRMPERAYRRSRALDVLLPLYPAAAAPGPPVLRLRKLLVLERTVPAE